jgi:hypothetical protein
MSIGHHDNPHALILPGAAPARSPEPALCTLQPLAAPIAHDRGTAAHILM